MSVDLRLVAPLGKVILAEDLWELIRLTFPDAATRQGLRSFAFSFPEGEFELNISDEGTTADISVPLSVASTQKGLVRPTTLGIILAQRFGWRCLNVETGREVGVRDLIGK